MLKDEGGYAREVLKAMGIEGPARIGRTEGRLLRSYSEDANGVRLLVLMDDGTVRAIRVEPKTVEFFEDVAKRRGRNEAGAEGKRSP